MRFVDEKFLEIEMPDGFVIPVLIKEVVPVARDEHERFGIQSPSAEVLAARPADLATEVTENQEESIFIGLIQETETHHRVYVVNNSSAQLLFSITYREDNLHKGLPRGNHPHAGIHAMRRRERHEKAPLCGEADHFGSNAALG